MKSDSSLSKRKNEPLSIERILSTATETRKAFDKLARNGMDPWFLGYVLCEIPELSARRVLITGKTNAGAKKFPLRVERLAEEIERVNSRSVLLRDLVRRWNQGPVRFASYYWEDFWRLPNTLRSYATWLRTAMKETTSVRDNPQKSGVIHLIVKIKAATKRFYFADLAILLDATFLASGISNPREYDEEGLRKLYKNNPRLVARLSQAPSPSPTQFK